MHVNTVDLLIFSRSSAKYFRGIPSCRVEGSAQFDQRIQYLLQVLQLFARLHQKRREQNFHQVCVTERYEYPIKLHTHTHTHAHI